MASYQHDEGFGNVLTGASICLQSKRWQNTKCKSACWVCYVDTSLSLMKRGLIEVPTIPILIVSDLMACRGLC
jgi:hypothetical protein